MRTHIWVALVILLVLIVTGIIIGLLLDESLGAALCHQLRLEGEFAYLLLVNVSTELFDFHLDLLAILNELMLGALSARAAVGFRYDARSPADNWAVRVLTGLYLLSLLLQGIQSFGDFFLATHPLLV
jgi:hypothetical protein